MTIKEALVSNNRRLPGFKPVMELLREAPELIIKIFCQTNRGGLEPMLSAARKNGVKVEFAEKSSLDALCDANQQRGTSVSHQGIVAFLSESQFASLSVILDICLNSPLQILVALDQVQDPGNLGAICRTAWALGCGGMILPKHNSAAPSPGAERSSAGALRKMPICAATNLAKSLDAAAEKNFVIYGTSSADTGGDISASCVNAFKFRWKFPCVIVLGNENRGIRPGVAKRCDFMINVPFARKFDSLNVAQSFAILAGLCAAQKENDQSPPHN